MPPGEFPRRGPRLGVGRVALDDPGGIDALGQGAEDARGHLFAALRELERLSGYPQSPGTKVSASSFSRDWCLCELIRLCNAASLEEAQELLDAIAMRQMPDIWSVGGKKRVLDPLLTYKEQTLPLLYSETESAVPAEDLLDWTEHPNVRDFRRHVLNGLHKDRHIEDDRDTEMVTLSPRGAQEVEDDLLPRLRAGR